MLALFLLVEADITLTAVAIGVSFRRRRLAATLVATAVQAAGVCLAMVLIWVLWFAGPLCVADTDPASCVARRIEPSGHVYAGEIALVQWAWVLGVALAAKAIAASTGSRGVRPT